MAKTGGTRPWSINMLGCIALLIGAFVFGSGGIAQSARTAPVLEIKGAIGPATSDYLASGLKQAEASGAPFVVIEMDTPVGLDKSMREIIQQILGLRDTLKLAVTAPPYSFG